MAGSGAEKAARREVLDSLARELRQPGGPGCRRRLTVRLIPYLSVRTPGQGRLRVYCISAGGAYAFLTGGGQLIRLGDGIAGAAREVTAACGQAAPGRPPARAAGHPGS